MEKEKTLVILKPDTIQRNLVGEVIARFEKVGLRIAGLKMAQIDKDMAFKHYGYDDGWFESVGKRMKEFYKKVGYDAGEDVSKLTNKEIGKLVQKWNVNYLTEGTVIAMILEGFHAIEIVRKISGATYGHEAAPGTIRGDYSVESPLTSNLQKRSVRNLIHASGIPEEAKLEIELWFKKEEIHE